LEGARSGLWFEFDRIIGEFRPRIVVVENVRGLLVRGVDTVLGGLADRGYDAEWAIVRAADVGAPHRRQRVFIIAYQRVSVAYAEQPRARRSDWQESGEAGARRLADAEYLRCEQRRAAHRVRFEVDRIPPTLYDKVQAKAKQQGISLRALTLTLWKEWLER
jgi:DNA (cytosine-5)-methyltransferase 1